MAFNIALSGLNAARADLDTIGNNIANSGTTGFKESRAEFAEVFSQSFGGLSNTAIGSGVRVASVAQQFKQGNIELTGNALDLAINGQGFFILSNGGSPTFTRDGSFRVDREGYIVTSAGARLQAFPSLADGSFSTGTLDDVRIELGVGAPNATTQVQASVNLAANAEILGGAAADLDPNDADTFNFTTSLTVFDSLGAPHTATLYARRLDNLEWSTRLVVDGQDLGTQDLTFDSNGQLVTPQPLAFPTDFAPGNGAEDLSLSFDFRGSTTLGTAFGVNRLAQDGFTTGELIGLDISSDGVIAARFNNGRFTALGKLALANFANPQGLLQIGNNQWAQSFNSGELLVGEAGSSNFGQIESGGLEASTVDLTTQLVNLITAQRAFQANSQVIRAEDEITQTAINLGR